MGKVILILGGVRSGKSSYALKLAKKFDKKVAFIATCQPLDKEMKKRISLHKKARPAHWTTFEESRNVSMLLRKIGSKFEVVVIDCLTLLVSNLLLNGFKERKIGHEIKEMLAALKKIKANAIIVSNEVGLGIVPDNRLARDFRDIVGKMNQVVAKTSSEVFFMVSGLPMKIKGEK